MDSRKKRNLLEKKGFKYNPEIGFWENDEIGIRLAVYIPIQVSLVELFGVLEVMVKQKEEYNKQREEFYSAINFNF